MSGDAGSPLIAVRRCAEAHALTARVRGDVDRGRDWLDILALIDQAERKVAAHDAAIRAEGVNGEQQRRLAGAIKDVCWRATPYGTTEDGDIYAYIVTKGAMHRLIGAAQGAGISAAFRAAQPTEGHIHECAIPAHRHNDLCICGGCGVRFDGAQTTEGES